MINFPDDFFKGETRDDFYIEPMMKSAWAAQLEVLKVVEAICDKHGIKYFAYWGTLLGAVRHGGYIPWDDDLDICMRREDYMHFIDIAVKELPSGFKMISPYTSDGWAEAIARVTNSQSVSFNKDFIKTFHGCPFCIGIDIFPYDYLPTDPEIQAHVDSLLELVSSLHAIALENSENPPAELQASMTQLAATLGYSYVEGKDPATQLLILYDTICSAYGTPSDKYLTCYPERFKRKRDYKLPAYWLEDAVDVPFECTTMRVPKYYELCLSKCYGPSFMTPTKGVSVHDYPFYKQQISFVEENGRWEELKTLIESIANERCSCTSNEAAKTKSEIYSISEKNDYYSALKAECNRKIILYYVSAMEFYDQEEQAFDKLVDTLNFFQNCTDKIQLIFVACDDVTDLLMHLNVELAYEYDDMRSYYADQDWLIYDDGTHLYDAIAVCDAFYGNQNIATGVIRKLGKPIMVQNVNISNTNQ